MIQGEQARGRAGSASTLALIQAVGALTLIVALAGAPGNAQAVLLLPVAPSASQASAIDLIVRSEARALTTGPITGSLIATNTPRLRGDALAAGFVPIGWGNSACEGLS